MQDKKNVLYNLRPASWYSTNTGYKIFESVEDFLSALDFVIKTYPPTSQDGLNWRKRVEKAYSDYKGHPINIPLWQDIADKYNWTR